MIVDILTGFVGLISTVVTTLGVSGTLFLMFGLLLLWLVLLCSRALLRFLLTCNKVWRRLPIWGKQAVGAIGLVGAYVLLWPFIPKTEAVVAVAVGFMAFWWYGGWQLSRRYGIDGGYCIWKPWVHHWEVTALQRGLTEALHDGTGRKNGRSRRPTMTDTGFTTVYEAPDQMSAQQLADDINNGTIEPSVARKIGWDRVNGTFAETDGNLVRMYVSATKVDGDDPLAHVHRWPGMEMTS